MEYTTKMVGTCAKQVTFEIIDGKVHNVRFLGGCNGNTQGVAALSEGMDAQEVIKRLEGIRCGFKSTSCPNEFAKGLKSVISQ